MSRTRFALLVLLAVALPATAGPGGLFVRKPKVDAPKARELVETLKSSPDEKRRKAAADELGGADPRLCPEVAPALVAALRKDTSAAVRVEAAESLRQLGEVFAQAGVALEDAVETDPSPLVRMAAKRALWDYHLSGYRPRKAADGLQPETVEPPLASPTGPRPAVFLVPAPPPALPPRVPPVAQTPAPTLPPVAAQPTSAPSGPRMSQLFWPNFLPGPRAAVRSVLNLGPPPILNVTGEPPLAKRPPGAPAIAVEPPKATAEPPLRLPRTPDYTPTLPPFQPDLPPIVTPPGTWPRR